MFFFPEAAAEFVKLTAVNYEMLENNMYTVFICE